MKIVVRSRDHAGLSKNLEKLDDKTLHTIFITTKKMKILISIRVTAISKILVATKIAAIVCLLSLSSLALTGDYDDLISSADSEDLTPQERAHFIDARDRFPKKWLSDKFKSISYVRWLDNTHLVFSTFKYPGWVAQKGEDPRVISVNVDTDEFVDLGYRGELVCMNHKGDLMIRLRRAATHNDSQNDHWFIGSVGQALQQIEWKPEHFIPQYTCRSAPYGDPIYTTPLRKLWPDAHRLIPLLPEHGVLKETFIFDFEERVHKHPIALVKPDGTSIPIPIRRPLSDNFEYQPWNDRYFESNPTDDTSIEINSLGEVFKHSPPKLLRFWHLSINAAGGGFGTRLGALWVIKGKRSKWRKQGLYLESDEGLLRIEDGSGYDAKASPNGCRILASVQKGDPWARKLEKGGRMIIDLCKQGAIK